MLTDVFKSDLFSFTSLTSAVNKLPIIPSGLALWLPWNAQGVTLRSVTIEEKDGVLTLVPAVPVGAPATQHTDGARKARSFVVPHYPFVDTIHAAEIQGVRAFGSDNELESVEAKINEKLTSMSNSHQATWEYGRAGAITGVLKNADGSTLYDWHTEFGVARNTKTIALDTATTNVVNGLIDAKAQSEDECADLIVDGYVLVCGRQIFRDFTGHPKVEKAYDRYQESSFLRDDPRKGFKLATDVTILEYTRGKVGSTRFVADDEAYLCPVAQGLYQTRFAPANKMSTANTVGLPLYTSSKEIGHDEGAELKTESNHLSYVTRPRAIVRIKKS